MLTLEFIELIGELILGSLFRSYIKKLLLFLGENVLKNFSSFLKLWCNTWSLPQEAPYTSFQAHLQASLPSVKPSFCHFSIPTHIHWIPSLFQVPFHRSQHWFFTTLWFTHYISVLWMRKLSINLRQLAQSPTTKKKKNKEDDPHSFFNVFIHWSKTFSLPIGQVLSWDWRINWWFVKPEITWFSLRVWSDRHKKVTCRDDWLARGVCHAQMRTGTPEIPKKVQSPIYGGGWGFLDLCGRGYFPKMAATRSALVTGVFKASLSSGWACIPPFESGQTSDRGGNGPCDSRGHRRRCCFHPLLLRGPLMDAAVMLGGNPRHPVGTQAWRTNSSTACLGCVWAGLGIASFSPGKPPQLILWEAEMSCLSSPRPSLTADYEQNQW